ncbi:DUF3987 domain-containing protein [Carboxylicivirga linearis]|uniref:DUF3987 domain-containing protein n=1 Tax=Carboxylicivirga linearis TaxID=1628157 RepID=A0ABS5JXR2_9BACT|nr:DUF3987 domain-containing protein [Carboxylicivirga linearis]MBS2099131.1 DUF3987 domain-containing protein [Carboxylicivirga linearis]
MINPIFEAFPKPIQDYTMEAKMGLNFPIEYVLSSVLYTSSVAIGNTHEVRVKNSWHEGASLFMAIVGETGVAKSHTISLALKPLFEKNQIFFNIYQEQLKEYQKYNKGKKGEGSESIIEPHLQQVLADDATLEAMYRIHYHNQRGIGVYFDELRGWFNNMGKYNKGSDQEVWLKIWSRKPILVNRVGSQPISIMSPHISVIGGIQTELLPSLFKDDRDKNGFIERILFVNAPNAKKENFSEDDMPKSVLVNYSQLINNLLNLPLQRNQNGILSPTLLELSPIAKAMYIDYYNNNAALVNSSNVCPRIKGFYAKFDTYSIRFALILQMLYWTCGEDSKESISERAMEGAIALSNFFLNNAKSAIEKTKSPTKLTNVHRKLFALELLERGNMSYREIGSIVNASHETVRKWHKAQLDS